MPTAPLYHGTVNELINVGGEKVAPGNVEEALRAHPAVADAVAFPLPHPTWASTLP